VLLVCTVKRLHLGATRLRTRRAAGLYCELCCEIVLFQWNSCEDMACCSSVQCTVYSTVTYLSLCPARVKIRRVAHVYFAECLCSESALSRCNSYEDMACCSSVQCTVYFAVNLLYLGAARVRTWLVSRLYSERAPSL
jgi:hypothetical protein